MEKIAGVDVAGVSLSKGRVMIQLRAGNAVRLGQIYEIIRQQGFTPRDANVVAAGRVVPREGRLEFQVSGIADAFVLSSASQPRREDLPSEQNIVVEAHIPVVERGPASLRITALRAPAQN